MEAVEAGGSLTYMAKTKREKKRHRETHSKRGKHCGSYIYLLSAYHSPDHGNLFIVLNQEMFSVEWQK